jgi:hypothetical protein
MIDRYDRLCVVEVEEVENRLSRRGTREEAYGTPPS